MWMNSEISSTPPKDPGAPPPCPGSKFKSSNWCVLLFTRVGLSQMKDYRDMSNTWHILLWIFYFKVYQLYIKILSIQYTYLFIPFSPPTMFTFRNSAISPSVADHGSPLSRTINLSDDGSVFMSILSLFTLNNGRRQAAIQVVGLRRHERKIFPKANET